jgi:predicted O-methyltransferase YrrM
MTKNPAYDFTSDWFSNHIPTWQQILTAYKPTRVLEIGCYEGRATTWLIENCRVDAGLEIHCVDPWAEYADLPGQKMGEPEARFDKNVAVASAINQEAVIHKHKKTSVIALAEMIAGGKTGFFDLIYVDGSHQAPDVLADAVMAFPLLRAGGIMIFDDYLWHMESSGAQNPYNMPKPAIDAFINIFQRKVQILSHKPLYQIYLRKLSD